MSLSFLLYILAFITIWYGAGLIISAVDQLSHKIHTSRFLVSFLLLGMLTSIPEMAVGLTSVIEQKPEIFVGNLLGGIPVLFLFVTPVLAILGNGLKIDHGFRGGKLISSLGVILTPSIFVLEGSVTNLEAILMIIFYGGLIYYLKDHTVEERKEKKKQRIKVSLTRILVQVSAGVVLIFISSHIIVEKTLQLAQFLHVSAFYVSLIGVSLGTNLPELSIAVRSIVQRKKDIAFGDYMGSAAANTLLFGICSLLIQGNTYEVQNYLIEFIILLAGLGLFYYFSLSKQDISRREGIALLGMFLVFCIAGIT